MNSKTARRRRPTKKLIDFSGTQKTIDIVRAGNVGLNRMRDRIDAEEESAAHEAALERCRRDISLLAGDDPRRVAAEQEKYEFHTTDFDVVVIADERAKPIWARHYEIGTNRPVFAGRDTVKRYALSDIERERRTGTPWYGNWPQGLLETEYPQWREARVVPQ